MKEITQNCEYKVVYNIVYVYHYHIHIYAHKHIYYYITTISYYSKR